MQFFSGSSAWPDPGILRRVQIFMPVGGEVSGPRESGQMQLLHLGREHVYPVPLACCLGRTGEVIRATADNSSLVP